MSEIEILSNLAAHVFVIIFELKSQTYKFDKSKDEKQIIIGKYSETVLIISLLVRL